MGSDSVFGVMSETCQGCNVVLMPSEYAQSLCSWCNKRGVVLILDKILAGFGHTGRLFGFVQSG
ncbi:MAG: aminotransferase class III-fold pyridoxal phosphate-dependent enzyme, partial [bacterium]